MRRLPEMASAQFGTIITSAVSLAPPYFTPQRIDEMNKATAYSEIKVAKLVPEPVAVASAYRFDQQSVGRPITVLVFDLGAAHLEVTLLRIRDTDSQLLPPQTIQIWVDAISHNDSQSRTSPALMNRQGAKQ
jgi:molecular chaperone DnaK (HSP70)